MNIPNGRRMNYGVPYKGSKNQLAESLCDQIPSADNFVDLFAGGCAVTHRMMLLNRYRHYLANDLDGQGVRLFQDAISGKYHNETRWISRDEFQARKATDPYISLVWSFGNNQRDYLYAREIEPWKKALHYARVFGDCSLLREMGISSDGSRKDVTAHEDEYKEKYIKWIGTEIKSRMKDLQSLESLESLQRLQSLQRLEVSFKSYEDVEIKPNSVIYCDPPYKGTNEYKIKFDSEAFYDWCGRQKELLLISEYAMPDDRFACVWRKSHTSKICDKATRKVTESLFVPRHQLELYRRMRGNGNGCQLTLFGEEYRADGSIIFTNNTGAQRATV